MPAGKDYASSGEGGEGGSDYGASEEVDGKEDYTKGSNYIACGTIGPCNRPRPSCAQAAKTKVILLECITTKKPSE